MTLLLEVLNQWTLISLMTQNIQNLRVDIIVMGKVAMAKVLDLKGKVAKKVKAQNLSRVTANSLKVLRVKVVEKDLAWEGEVRVKVARVSRVMVQLKVEEAKKIKIAMVVIRVLDMEVSRVKETLHMVVIKVFRAKILEILTRKEVKIHRVKRVMKDTNLQIPTLETFLRKIQIRTAIKEVSK